MQRKIGPLNTLKDAEHSRIDCLKSRIFPGLVERKILWRCFARLAVRPRRLVNPFEIIEHFLFQILGHANLFNRTFRIYGGLFFVKGLVILVQSKPFPHLSAICLLHIFARESFVFVRDSAIEVSCFGAGGG